MTNRRQAKARGQRMKMARPKRGLAKNAGRSPARYGGPSSGLPTIRGGSKIGLSSFAGPATGSGRKPAYRPSAGTISFTSGRARAAPRACRGKC